MKKFIIKVIIFFAVIAVIDIIFGMFCGYLNSHAKGGDTYNHYYIANEMKDSVLIFGSSRAIHHYNPQILEDSLHTTVYNCGLDGNGILYQYGRLLTILDHHTPKSIIYDVIPSFDMETEDNSKYLQWQKRWYDKPGIPQLFHDINPAEDIKMHSNLYRYNSTFIQMLSDNLKPQQKVGYKGYKPLDEIMDYEVEPMESEPAQWDDLKLEYFTKFIKLCEQNDIELIIAISPWYNVTDSGVYQNMLELCRKYNLRIIDLFSDPEISTNKAYFADASHLNSHGADIFTSKFANLLLDKKLDNNE